MRARQYRLARIREQLLAFNCAAILLYDPVNIRYALDASNMQVWTSREATRYALIFADGPAIMFEFKGCHHLCDGLDGIDEVRNSITWNYMCTGDLGEARAADWAAEIVDLVRLHGGGNHRIGIDKVEPTGLAALQALGLEYVEGQHFCALARSIKSEDELTLMRWTVRVCEAAMARIYTNSLPGRSEQQLWAELHFENARSGGEWLEYWYQECTDYLCQEGEMISFDTDMVGPYGYCADLSRSWTCGYTPMTPKQSELYSAALEQIDHNLSLLRPGLELREFNEKSWQIPQQYQAYRYSLAAHGVGMVDEWPIIPLHLDYASAYDARLEQNMVLCVESLIAEQGSESIKLETQVVITENGCQALDSFPFEDVSRAGFSLQGRP